MITETTRPRTEAELPDEVLEELAERIGRSARAEAIFGTPVERDGTTVLPVAKMRWGVGGGFGRKAGPPDQGAGAGAGVTLKPVGYIEMRGGKTQFRAIVDPATVLGAAAGGAFLLYLLVRRAVG